MYIKRHLEEQVREASRYYPVVIEGDKLYPIEIKKGKEPAHADRNFSVLQKFSMNIQPGLILCMSDDLIPYSRNAWYCPVSAL